MADPATLAFYAAEASAYTSWGQDAPSEQLESFLARLQPGAAVLELGCGAGRDSEAMIARGFDVTLTDGVPEMAAAAARRLGRAVAVLRFDELDAVSRYDGVWAQASLLHVPRAAVGDTVASIDRALRPGGWHFASFKGGGVEGRDRLGRYFDYLSTEEVETVYRDAGEWAVVDLADYKGSGYDGVCTPWTALTVQKAMTHST